MEQQELQLLPEINCDDHAYCDAIDLLIDEGKLK
jgi:hypothetical protein